MTVHRLGHVLLHIYDFDFGGAIYLPDVERFEGDTPCVFVPPAGDFPCRDCLDGGFGHWLNVAVVSDTCDGVAGQTEADLVAAFNEDCRAGGWLQRMMDHPGGEGP